jgi:uncharacterized protein YfaS (alpha-2-macroglobulin family)
MIKKVLLAIFAVIGFTITTVAQIKNNYEKNWKKVDDLEKKGLTKSALEEVVTIYNLAVKDNNDPQQIKAAMYQVKYRNMVQEDSHENNIFFVDTLIAKAKGPAKNVLQSMQAEMFGNYLQNNRWKFRSRTALAEEKSKDITTWSLEKLHETIGNLYKASLNNEAALKNTKVDDFDPVIVKGENTRQLRPTLFDFLAFRALNYFMSDDNDLTKPTYQFTINEAAAFAPANEFIKLSFKTKDTASLHNRALLLFRELLQFHLADAQPNALIDADLVRLSFVNQYGVIDGKEKWYEEALKNIETKYASNPSSAQAMFLRARLYFQKGQDYNAYTKPEHQYEIKRAKELAEAAFAKFPKSEGGINAENLVLQIQLPSIKLETEKVNVIGQPFRTLVNYKNAKTVYLRIIKTTKEEIKRMDRGEYETYWKNIAALKPLKSWKVDLPDPQDFQDHAAEIKIDGVDNGIYFILASLNENFSTQKNILSKQLTYVSNISYIHNSGNEYYVLHRDNGKPLANTTIQVWETKYNYTTSRNEEIKAESYQTNTNGYFKIKQPKQYRTFTLQFKNGTDELFMDESNYNNNYYNSVDPIPYYRTFLFTDRSIYRPGQTMYFKGIVIKNDPKNNKNEIAANFKTTLLLRDANNQKVAELVVTTNDYGSYKGTFKLPEGSLNGQFNLFDTATAGTQYFSVEEYKRPKFFVAIEKPKGTYRVNDSIKVTGTAKAYAGNNIDGAAVKYRVVRKVQYPVWWGWGYYSKRGGYFFPSGNEEMEITNGTATTDAKGEFHVTFKAIPDESVDKKSQPVFHYEVSADITDINGETKSGETSVAVAYQMLQLNINLPEKVSVDSLKNLMISSTNLNDIHEKATVNVTIQKVVAPAKIFRERYWDMPDQFVMNKEEYYTIFPYDIYKDEDQPNKWSLGEKVADITDTTAENSHFNDQNIKAVSGWYKIVAVTKDKYGEEVRAEKYIQLTSDNDPIKEAVAVDIKKGVAEPGETISYTIKTGFDNIWLIHSFTKMDKHTNIAYPVVTVARPFVQQVVVKEEDRGGMGMSYAFVQHNRVYKGNESFSIPWSNKDLDISYATFRDKLLPGSEEKWKVKITGTKGEKVAAEMLAGMYDASLDQFKPHSWNRLSIWQNLYVDLSWNENGFSQINSEEYNKTSPAYLTAIPKRYDALTGIYTDYYSYRDMYYYDFAKSKNMPLAEAKMNMAAPPPPPSVMSQTLSLTGDNMLIAGYSGVSLDKERKSLAYEHLDSENKQAQNNSGGNDAVQIRKNFNETAFFFPDLVTDADGNIEFSFTIPEALTKWKLMTLAHTKELASAYSEKTTVTQKPLMVQPNAPRFLREGDRMEFSAKVVNLSDTEVTGTAQLELLDAATNKPVDGWFKNVFPVQYFTIAAGQSSAVKFPIDIPFNFNSAMTYRIVAKTTQFSDGEEMAIPVLTNRMLVTESMPINLRNQTTKTFRFDKLLNSGNSESLSHHALTVEYTSNPAWYAVQALPYLMEYPYECAEQTFNRYYANTLATYISNSTPKIKAVFEKWKTIDTAALMSNLQKNEELKSALLQETPWVLEAQNESQQKKNIALLFDMVKMSSEMNKAFNKLKEAQSSNGGFTWFRGGPDDRYITQYIITGIGHLRKLNALTGDNYEKVKPVVANAVPYLDKKIKEEYDDLIKNKARLSDDHLSNTAIQYLYMRSFFPEYTVDAASKTAYTYYTGQAAKYWLSQSKYMQAMIAIALNRTANKTTPKNIIRSLKENAIVKEEMGMYWKEWATGGYYWYQAPVESQALMIEAFTEVDGNTATIDDLKTWLLKQKQTQNWKTTKATAEACYALLIGGSNWLAEEKEVTINLGSTVIKSTDAAAEAGTGYFKKRIEGEKIKSEMGNITVSAKSADSKVPPLGGGGGGASWGSIYWQYFEDLDKITSAETPLKLNKKLFIERNSDHGPVLEELKDDAQLKIGDKIKVRIELRVDRDMEYVHMKDMRAACMEPTNVISTYKWQGGLGYYESTKDASTNFFFSWLSRGTYVFEYPMFVTHAGNFSNGITTIQCMYAPEFTSHSEGIRVSVE